MIAIILVGVGAGVVSGLLGVGGGILFVPGLVVLAHLGQVGAESTSLVAIVPVAVVGTWRQRRYGNVRLGDGALIGALSLAGTVGGVALANVVPERVLRIAFAALMVAVAVQLVRRDESEQTGPEPG